MHKTICILFGGKSAEHEVSLRSARNIVDALDRKRFTPILIKIQKDGTWNHVADETADFTTAQGPLATLYPGGHGKLMSIGSGKEIAHLDAVFPILHGPFGEDGTVQGLLKLADVPFVGPSVLSSAMSMDKDVMKRLLRDADIPIAKFTSCTKDDVPSFAKLQEELGIPFFVKPANMGSSVGVTKVISQGEYKKALEEAFLYDTKIIIEEGIVGREIECAVLGNEEPRASMIGEIVASQSFYSYDAKYASDQGTELIIPAKLPTSVIKRTQAMALQTFKTLCCEGLSRVDFFLKENGDILVNEINTIPGFTNMSMYPKLWEVSGLSYTELITQLIELAMERHTKEKSIKTSH